MTQIFGKYLGIKGVGVLTTDLFNEFLYVNVCLSSFSFRELNNVGDSISEFGIP